MSGEKKKVGVSIFTLTGRKKKRENDPDGKSDARLIWETRKRFILTQKYSQREELRRGIQMQNCARRIIIQV